jgi:hypothetical protein
MKTKKKKKIFSNKKKKDKSNITNERDTGGNVNTEESGLCC